MKKILVLSLVILLSSIVVFSDIARPPANVTPAKTPKPKGADATMQIRLMSNASVATLSIPKAQIKSLRAQLDELDSDDDATAANTNSFSRTQTIVSASFISLALLFGGIWFVRSGKTATKGGKAAVALLVTLGIASAATLVYANAGPPPITKPISSKLFDKRGFDQWGYGVGKIKVVLHNDDPDTYFFEVPDVTANTSTSEE